MGFVRISHRDSGTVLAEGPLGWGITPFDGGYYVAGKYLRTDGFTTSGVPGLCPYKFLYIWMNLRLADGSVVRDVGWKYVVPNPLFPFTAWRVAVSQHDARLTVEKLHSGAAGVRAS